MKIGVLLTENDTTLDKNTLHEKYDFAITNIPGEVFPSLKTDLITDYQSSARWNFKRDAFYTCCLTAEANKQRLWMPAVVLVFAYDYIQHLVSRLSVDVVFFGSMTPSDTLLAKIFKLNEMRATKTISYAPLIVYDKETSLTFINEYTDLISRPYYSRPHIAAILPDENFAKQFKRSNDFCDELVLWSYASAEKYVILENKERIIDMAKKIVGAPPKKPTIKGIIIIGPIGIRKEASLSSAPFKILPKGAELSFVETVEPKPGLVFGKLEDNSWVLIRNGSRKFVAI